MKKMLLTLSMLALGPSIMLAQDADYPTIYIGYDEYLHNKGHENTANQWRYYYDMENGDYGFATCLEVLSDSVVDERTYHKVVVEDNEAILYRQEGDKVLLFDGTKESVVLDYGLGIGETFEDMSGRRYVVTDILHSEQDTFGWWRCDALEGDVVFLGQSEPRILRLSSTDEQDEDLWIEGIGSVQWGIVPLAILKDLSVFEGKLQGLHLIGSGINNIVARLNVNGDSYKMIYFAYKESDIEGTYERIAFSFSGDTLNVKGWTSLNKDYCYAECVVNGNQIDVTIHDESSATNRVGRPVNLNFTGFKAGTYEVGLAGKEHVTLVCDGANGVENISETLRHENPKDGIYDLSGRRVDAKAYENENGKRKKGIYIKDGKKFMVR